MAIGRPMPPLVLDYVERRMVDCTRSTGGVRIETPALTTPGSPMSPSFVALWARAGRHIVKPLVSE